MNTVLVAMALAVAFGSSAMAAETAGKPSVAELVAAANTLAACLTPLAREADKTAAKIGKSRFNHVERQIAHDKRKFLDSEIEVKVAQCIEAACPVLGDAASDDFYGLAFSCRQSALSLRKRADMSR